VFEAGFAQQEMMMDQEIHELEKPDTLSHFVMSSGVDASLSGARDKSESTKTDSSPTEKKLLLSDASLSTLKNIILISIFNSCILSSVSYASSAASAMPASGKN
jgi:hypothetical protein